MGFRLCCLHRLEPQNQSWKQTQRPLGPTSDFPAQGQAVARGPDTQ